MLVDDHQLFVDGIKALLKSHECIEVVAEANNSQEALNRLPGSDTTLVLMEIHLPDLNGIETTRHIRQRFPSVQVVMLTTEQEGPHIQAALSAGARGYILKHGGQAELIHGIEAVSRGQRYFSDAAAHQMMHTVAEEAASPWSSVQFSRREKEVLHLVVAGHTNDQISIELGIGIETVRTYRKHLRRKSAARNVADLVRRAIQQDWVQL